ncbi:MAG: hypothetical protein PHT88_02945 [Candidatus Moranbacteria bacterium]|nr:hypothetical protein [Candidatus Moranbacteria bacterium]
MKIQFKVSHLFIQYKKVFSVFLSVFLFSSMFVFAVPQAHADCGWWTKSLDDGSCPWEKVGADIGIGIDSMLKPAAVALLSVEAGLANAAAVLFAYILDPNSFSSIMNNGVFYEIWKIVRDTMNMLFILVLLFSAFATIYQVDKYKYNRILWMVIIMALLVNFSWPISRTIIDFFNSMMYFFVQSVFQTTGPAAASGILGGAQLEKIFLPQGAKSDWALIFLAIIVMFIFMITLLVLSLMLLVRLVALPILVMFSPIGFAGMAAPITQGYAKKWWDKLFQYASYGPIAVFMVLVSIRVLGQMQNWKMGMATTFQGMGANTGSINTDILVTLVYFAVPIILFWIAITSAEKMSSELGYTGTKYGSMFVKWAGRQPWRGAKGAANWTGVPGGVKQAWKDRRMMFGSDARRAQERREGNVAALLAGGTVAHANALDAAFAKRVAAEQESLKKLGNVTQAQAMLRDKKFSPEKKKAAALYLSEKEALTGAGDFQMALQAVGKDLSAAKGIIAKAPKSVLQSAGDFEKSLEILNANGNQKLLGDMVAKAEKGALGANGEGYDKVLAQLQIKQKDANGNVMKDASGKEMIDIAATGDLKKMYDKRLVEQGQAHIRVQSNLNSLKAAGPITPAAQQKAYADVFNKISANDMAKQDETMLISRDFIDYMTFKTEQSQKEAYAAMARENREAIVSAWEVGGVKSRA